MDNMDVFSNLNMRGRNQSKDNVHKMPCREHGV